MSDTPPFDDRLPIDPDLDPNDPGEPHTPGPVVGSPEAHHHRTRFEILDDDLPIDPDLDPDDSGEPHIPSSQARSSRSHQHRAHPDILIAIAVGGGLGTLARAGLGSAFPNATGHFPFTTLGINVVGSFVLGLLLVAILDRIRTPRHLRPFVATGVLGGFTTFSTFMVGTVQLARHGHVFDAPAYLIVSVVGGCAAALGGIRLADVITPPVAESEAESVVGEAKATR